MLKHQRQDLLFVDALKTEGYNQNVKTGQEIFEKKKYLK